MSSLLLLFSCQVMSDSAIPWTAVCQASLSLTVSQSLPKFMSIASVMPSNHLTLCHPLLLLPSIFPSNQVFSNESTVRIRWPKYWSFSFSISPSKVYSGLISLKIDWFDHLAFQGTLKSLLQKHSSQYTHIYHICIHIHILIGSQSYNQRERTIQLEKCVNSLSTFENYHVQHILIGSIRILIMKTWKVVWQAEIWWP